MTVLSDIVDGELQQLATGFQFTEGPLWHPHGYWLFVDTRPNLVYKLTPGGTPEVYRDESGRANGLTFDLEGRLLMCEGYGRRVSRREHDGTITTLVDNFQGKRLNRPNDLVMRSDGILFFTDPQRLVAEEDRELGESLVFRLTIDGELTVAVDDIDYPNGLAFSPDEGTFYLINTYEPKLIRAYDIDAKGALSNGRDLVDMSGAPGEGNPDGMKLDTKGRIYSSGPGGAWVLEPDGSPIGTVPTPEPPTNVAFGGDDYDTLLITAHTSVYSIKLKTTGVLPPGAKAARAAQALMG
jgi:gluconolactonase